MKRNGALVIGLIALVAVAGGVLFMTQRDPEGQALGAGSKTEAMWSRLSGYQDTYLRKWMAANGDGHGPRQVLDAFEELGYQVTGPGGFWRKEVRQRWLGCDKLPDQASCLQFEMAEGDFQKWDTFVEGLGEVKDDQAARFIDKHYGEMMDYLDRYVPDDPSATGMQKTRFYDERLKGAMAADPLL